MINFNKISTVQIRVTRHSYVLLAPTGPSLYATLEPYNASPLKEGSFLAAARQDFSPT